MVKQEKAINIAKWIVKNMPRTGKRLSAKRKRILKMEMELVGTKIIGLPNGLELICKLFEDETNYKISRAAMLVPTGAGQLGLAEWLPYAKIHKGVIISKNHIMYVVDGNDDVVNKYQTTIGSGIVVPTSSGPVGGDVGGDTSPSLKLTT